jgi:integrase
LRIVYQKFLRSDRQAIDITPKIKAIASKTFDRDRLCFKYRISMVTINSSKKHGIASLESYRGRLRIHLPRAWYPNQNNKYLTLGLADTLANRELATRKLNWIQGELDNRTFDVTLERYLDKPKPETYLQVVDSSTPQITLKNLWDSYINYLKPIRKESTIHYLLANISPKIERCEHQSPYDAIAIREWLLANTTPSMTKRVLQQLNASFNWGLQHKKLVGNTSPFEGMAKEFKHRFEEQPEPQAFTSIERDRVLEAFKNHRAKGYNYSYYAPFVEFMFLTGCRPSEAIGLTWNDIALNFSSITFNGGILMTSGKKISSQGKGSKNNKIRKFPCNEKVREFLRSLPRQNELVFPSPKGKSINYDNFSKRAWNTIVDPIKPDTTPYSCRDTFITEQVAKNVNSAVLAKWTDNSVKTIEKYYLDMSSIDHILPQ